MADGVGRGLSGSLRAHVRAELRDLYRHNATLRRARSGLFRRILVGLVSGIKLSQLIPLYLCVLGLWVLIEWSLTEFKPCLLPGWGTFDLAPFLKDVNSYFITGQIGTLAIVSIAVGVVTLLMQRDDRSSGTTDVRLYYSQSFAYEVATSGVALLIVLCVQLFWPAQFFLHLLQAHGANLTFELGLTILHAAWMLANLLLFYQFIVTTLRFVEPDARRLMRDRYTADIAMPRDLARRLTQALYLNAPRALFGDALEEGPNVQFGFGSYFLSKAGTEIELGFHRPSRLFDVRMGPLGFVLRRWRTRIQAGPVSRDARLSGRKWGGELNIPHSFESQFDGPTAWLLREGQTGLNGWERFVVRHSFRFVRTEKEARDPLTPNDFMGDLTDRLVGQIDRRAVSGVSSALKELVAYHAFVLATQDTATTAGEAINLAQIGGVFGFDRPDQSWIRLYRRIYFAAVDKMDAEPEIIDRLGYVARSLVPPEARSVSPAIVTTLLDLGYFEVVALEAWLARRTTVEHEATEKAQPRLVLAGTDRRTCERTLIGFIGAWESTLQTASIAYKWRESESGTDAVQWASRSKAWPFIQAHLHACAYFFVLAVWNEDEMGADRYRDMFLRWLNPFYDELRNDFAYQHPEFLLPSEVFGKEWVAAAETARAFSRGFPGRLSPKSVTEVTLRTAHDDVLVISAAIALSWAIGGNQSTDIASRQAIALLQRTILADQGSTLLAGVKQVSPFWVALSLVLKTSVGSRFENDVSYVASLNGLVDRLSTMSERRIVSGRIYSSQGVGGLDKLRPFLLAVMAAHFPADDAAITAWWNWFIANNQILSEGDPSLRNLAFTLQSLANYVLPERHGDAFDKALSILNVNADLAAKRTAVRSLLDGFAERLAALRSERLRAARVDPAKLSIFRDALRRELLAQGPLLTAFHSYDIRRSFMRGTTMQIHSFGYVDKAMLITQSMSDVTPEDFADTTVSAEREYLAQHVWRAFWALPRKTVAFNLAFPPVARWQALLAAKDAVGSRPTLLVPWEPFADELTQWMYRQDRPGDFLIEHIDGMPEGGDPRYVGTIDGLHVLAMNGLDRAVLHSGEALRAIVYQLLPDLDDVVDLSLVEAANPAESRFEIRTAQSLDWSDAQIVEFRWQNPEDVDAPDDSA
jgi:hypothetical protein